MRRPGLSITLIGVNVGLVLAAVICVAAVAVTQLRRLAEDQALARLDLSASAALGRIDLASRDLLTSAQLLAERPTLARSIVEGNAREAEDFLRRFQRTSGLAGCAVVVRDGLFAHGGSPIPWSELESGLSEEQPRCLIRSPGGGPLVLGARWPIPPVPAPASPSAGQDPGARVLVARLLDEAFLRDAVGVGGLPVSIIPRGSASGVSSVTAVNGDDSMRSGNDAMGGRRELGSATGDMTAAPGAPARPAGDAGSHPGLRRQNRDEGGAGQEEASSRIEEELQALRAQALDSEAAAGGRIDAAGLYALAVPVRAPTSEIVGILQTTLPGAAVDSSVNSLVRTLVLISIAVAGLAAVASVYLGRRAVQALEELAGASSRIGRGDLATPIPRRAGKEIGALAASMEEMRRGLLRVTADLRGQQGETEAILHGITEGVFTVDGQRRIRYLNPQAATLLGVVPSDAMGRFCGDVLRPDEPGGLRPCEERCPILDARFRGSARATEHLRLASGAHRTVVITSASMDPGGEQSAASPWSADRARQVQVMRDETEIEATHRLRDAVLANISHEFRTPLTAQLASIELLGERLGDLSVDDARGLVRSLERGTLRLTQLIDNLLESVRIDTGRDSIRRQPVALDEVIEEAVEVASPLLAQRGQTLSVELPFPLPGILGDAPRLVQVFVNLLANAHKFSPAGSAIRVGGAVAGGTICLWVEDEGPGLPAGGNGSLFERFVRTAEEGEETEDEPPQSGMGLGLWIVKSIVERHGGRVEAHSGEGGRGTRMSLYLPCRSA